jgi:phosphatidylglycerol---prolipoprotein diacylglyceryl transferase
MPDLMTRVGPFTFLTFTLFLALAVLLSIGAAAYRSRKTTAIGLTVDAYLGAIIGGVIGARLLHVLINWDYFGLHTDEISRLGAGGLDWHGAVIGGLVGLAIVACWRKLDIRGLLDNLTPMLPLLALGSWYGCWASACGYGAEVDTLARYPAYAVSESRDVYGIVEPRYNTQLFGIGVALVVLVIALLLMRADPLRTVRFWVVLALLSVGMAGIGFARGDYAPVVAGLRLDQWLDIAVIVLCVIMSAVEIGGGRRAASLQTVQGES